MPRRPTGSPIITIAATLVMTTNALADTRSDCTQNANAEQQITACTTLLSDPTLSPEDRAGTFYNLGNAHAAKEDYAAAAKSYSQAISIDPTNADFFFNRADVLGRMDETEAAIADLFE